MENALIYHDPINPAPRPKTDDSTWDKVLASHKEKNYRGVVLGILDYIDLDLASRTGNADRSHFDIPHGSITLQLNLTDNAFTVNAPFLDIRDSKRIPLLRKVTELNFSPLNLSSIRLEGDQLAFCYSSPLSLCEPYRTYDALREICIYADSYDDEFITKFNASWIRQPVVEHYSEEAKKAAYENMLAYMAEAKEGVNYFETKRSFNLAWDVIVITLMKLEYHIRPQGMLRTRLEKMISYLTSSEDAMNEKVNRGKKYLAELENYPREDFIRDLYVPNTFIPYKVRSSAQAVRNNAENSYTQARKEIDQRNYLGAAMTLTYHFFHLFYHNTVPEHIENAIREALRKSGGQPWKEASGILYEAMHDIMTSDRDDGGGTETAAKKKKKGFFHKLFGG
jgi:hypothetical protein